MILLLCLCIFACGAVVGLTLKSQSHRIAVRKAWNAGYKEMQSRLTYDPKTDTYIAR